MGLLDDAIREHLELKRRHGADPSEVQRQEREALGPARRGPEPLEVPPPAAAQPPAAEPQEPEAAQQEPADPVLIEPEVDPPAYREPDEEPEPEPESRRVRAEAELEDEDLRWEAPGERSSRVNQPTVAFEAADVEEAQRRPDPQPAPERREEAAAPAESGDEDVLEETPDFLQETPEHDRLWFEQRPPRDFDFDG